jgi:hypothetical protein
MTRLVVDRSGEIDISSQVQGKNMISCLTLSTYLQKKSMICAPLVGSHAIVATASSELLRMGDMVTYIDWIRIDRIRRAK